jgi:hypothetical protein
VLLECFDQRQDQGTFFVGPFGFEKLLEAGSLD